MSYFQAHERLRVDNYLDSDQDLEFEFTGYGETVDIWLTRSQLEDLVDHLTKVLEERDD